MLDARRIGARERRTLRPLGRVASCSVERLRAVSEFQLRALLDDRDAHDAWSAVSGELADACPIEDGTTGGVNPGDRRALWYLVRALGARRVLEVGTHVGASTVHIAAALRPLHAEGARLDTVDVRDVNDDPAAYWRDLGLAASPRDMLEKLGCREQTAFLTMTSLEHLAGSKSAYDFIFLDGDHAAPTVYQEIPLALEALRPDGVILLHDYFPKNRPLWPGKPVDPGPFTATARLRAEGAAFDVLPLGDLPWTTKGASKRTSLALLARAP